MARYEFKEDVGAAQEVKLLPGAGMATPSTFGRRAGTGQSALAAAAQACERVIAVDGPPVMVHHQFEVTSSGMGLVTERSCLD